MKNRNRRAALVLIILSALALGACVSTGPATVDTKDMPGPETHTLAYGYLGFHNPFGKTAMDYATFNQLSPDHPAEEYVAIRPSGNHGDFFLYPQPVGTSWKLFSFQKRSGNSVTLYLQGVRGKNPYDPRMDKPGLLYIGAWAYSRDPGTSGAVEDWGIHELPDEGYELDVLKAMLPQFKKTAWQGLIEKRIEELTK